MSNDQDDLPLTDPEIAERTFVRTLELLRMEGYGPSAIMLGLIRCTAVAADRLERVLYDDDETDED